MDRKRAAELLPIIKAFAEGEDIRFRMGDSEWLDLPKEEHLIMSFPAADYEYRVKPKLFECWIMLEDERISSKAYPCKQSGTFTTRQVHMREVE